VVAGVAGDMLDGLPTEGSERARLAGTGLEKGLGREHWTEEITDEHQTTVQAAALFSTASFHGHATVTLFRERRNRANCA
jgi:hypothetical protein